LPRTSLYSTERTDRGKTVAVIASRDDLLRAKRLAAADLFELRLVALAPIVDQVEREIRHLNAPLIITARHSREGGALALAAARRAQLLLQFLKHAAYIDVELRAWRELATVRWQARAQKTIISAHELRDTPSLARLRRKAVSAARVGADIFKIVTRTDAPEQVDRLLEFFDNPHVDLPISAMGFGKFGRVARLELAARGSVLNYVHLGKAQVRGQFSLSDWKKIMRHLHRSPR
jgi:3-dehydroquinate dehydratase-1